MVRSTLRRADRILVIDRGQLTESGSHEELMARGGHYGRLVHLQGTAAERPEPDGQPADGACGSPPHSPRSTGTRSAGSIRLQRTSITGTHNTLHVTVRDERVYAGVFAMETDLGPMRFTIRAQSDRVQDFGDHGKMLLDTDANRYLIPNVESLTLSERRAFRRHISW